MKKYLFLVIAITGLVTWSCSKTDTSSDGLKGILYRNVSSINDALSAISTTPGYKMLSANAAPLKSDVTFEDSITLSSVAGIYDFQPDTMFHRDFYIPFPLFKKTGNSDMMVVNLPEKLVFHPRYLHGFFHSDSVLTNNFSITASDYHYYYTLFNNFDYKLQAGFTLNDEDIGSLDILTSGDRNSGYSYSSKYTFSEGYNINVGFQSGDTTTSSFALSDNDNVLLKETRVSIGTDFHNKERQYILSVGNVDIKRSTGIDSIQVFVDGVLQQKAAVKIFDENGSDGSICHHRDIMITYDDGTTTNLSELINPAMETLRTLVDSLHSMNFATNIVNYIAISIYYYSHL
jgi:hypothetical protein